MELNVCLKLIVLCNVVIISVSSFPAQKVCWSGRCGITELEGTRTPGEASPNRAKPATSSPPLQLGKNTSVGLKLILVKQLHLNEVSPNLAF